MLNYRASLDGIRPQELPSSVDEEPAHLIRLCKQFECGTIKKVPRAIDQQRLQPICIIEYVFHRQIVLHSKREPLKSSTNFPFRKKREANGY